MDTLKGREANHGLSHRLAVVGKKEGVVKRNGVAHD